MLTHSVYFWLDRKLSKDDFRRFVEGLETLRGIECVEALYVGQPAPTDRPAVDRTYDAGLTVLLQDMDAHDQYQQHPLHQEFLKTFSSSWTKVVIYDHQPRS